MRELSGRAVVVGTALGAVLGAANAYVGLRLGLGISVSIPAAIISMALMRVVFHRSGLLENNIVQTIASAGQSVAMGALLTLPALRMLGFSISVWEMMTWSCLGGVLGVLCMVPLRRTLIEQDQDQLPFPEGVACAAVLRSGQRAAVGARNVCTAAGVAAVYTLIQGLGFWREKAVLAIPWLRTAIGLESSPALLGVGYLLGPRIAVTMFGGAVLGWLVVIPLVGLQGQDLESGGLLDPTDPGGLWSSHLRAFGAGAIALSGLIALFKSVPTLLISIRRSISTMLTRDARNRGPLDIPFPLLLLAVVGLAYAAGRIPQIGIGGAVCVVVLALLLVAVASQLAGLVGQMLNPIPALMVVVLLSTALVCVYLLEANIDAARLTILAVGTIVAVALAVAGDCAQDLKTGHILEATPYKQQLGKLIGVVVSAAVIALVVDALGRTQGFLATEATPRPLPAYDANFVKILVEGATGGKVPWVLVLTGAAAALAVELLGKPSLAFAVGLYLPISVSTPIMAGAAVRWLVGRRRQDAAGPATAGGLAACGLVAGYAVMGLVLTAVAGVIAWAWNGPTVYDPLTAMREPVAARHFQLWLADTLGFDPTYGLAEAVDTGDTEAPATTRPVTTRPAATQRATAWPGPMERGYTSLLRFNLLPLIPFGLLVFWLLLADLRRVPPPAKSPPDGPATPPEPNIPKPIPIGHKGPLIKTPVPADVPSRPSDENSARGEGDADDTSGSRSASLAGEPQVDGRDDVSESDSPEADDSQDGPRPEPGV
jgi:putative OPT family oligopeptide transporter